MAPDDDLDDTFLDSLTTIDEHLERNNKVLDDVLLALQEVIDIGGEGLPAAEGEGGGGIPRKKESIDLTAKVPSNDGAKDKETMPFDGFVNGIIGGWPDGSDLSVGARVVNDETGTVYLPSGDDEYASYNDFTTVFPVSFAVEEGDVIASEYKNNKSHPVPINITLQLYGLTPTESIQEVKTRLE